MHNKITCVESGIRKICSEFSDLVLDAHHEVIYEMEKHMSIEEYTTRGDRYNDGKAAVTWTVIRTQTRA